MKNDRQNKVIEIELIDNNIKLIKHKLAIGASTLQRETISQLMTLISKLTLKKDFLELQQKFVEYKEHTDTRIKDLELFIKSRNTSRNKSRHKFRITNFPIKYTQVKLYHTSRIYKYIHSYLPVICDVLC
jgi:hypothetical protein